jgi:AraC-like DNA-binding protein/mannose-6-phosphate isomerase-like protein (cupin superfamily)
MNKLAYGLNAHNFVSPKSADESFRLIEINGGYSGCSWHFHPEFQLGYVVSGTGQRVVGDSVHSIEAGEVVLLGPNLPHVWHYDCGVGSQPVEAVAVHFHDNFLGREFFETPEASDLRLLLSRASQGLQVVGQTRCSLAPIIERMRKQSGFPRLLTMLEILDVIARSRDVLTLCSPLFQPTSTGLDLERLRRVCDYIQSNFNQPLDRDMAADIAHMSPSGFSRLFKSRTGMSFSEYVSDIRIGHACRRLMELRVPITDIALECGFSDLSTFNRTFRKLRQMTPTEFRARMQHLSHVGRSRE